MSKDGLELAVSMYGPVVAGRPVDAGLALAITSIAMPFFSTLAVGLRSYWRFWAKKGTWGWDDILAILSLASFIVACAFSFISAQYGLGSRDISRANLNKVFEILITFAPFYLLALGLVKISVAISVLRFSFQRRYRWPIIGLSMITIIAYAFSGIWVIALCGSFFRKKPGTICDDTQVEIDMFVTVISLVTDAGCVFIPIFVVRNLRVSRRSKIGLMAALGVGMLPLVAAVIRLPFSYIWDHPTSDSDFYYIVLGPLLSVLEVGLALVSASLPIIGGMFKCFSQPATASMGNLNTATADLSATSAPTDLERGSRWIKYSWRTKSTSTTRSILENEESSSGQSNPVFQRLAVKSGRGNG